MHTSRFISKMKSKIQRPGVHITCKDTVGLGSLTPATQNIPLLLVFIMKWYLLFLFLFINVISCQRRTRHENIKEFGKIYPDDILLYNRTIEREARSRSGVITYDLNYELFGDEGTLISGIKIIGPSNERKPGIATLKEGGPEQRSADIHFESQRGGGLHFRVLIYGYEDYYY
ncbi:hypothetical protein K501DRAFT_271430 [Backusella circina FSU 941]|nr:hypothetical protein K501DRAFT_271430 [Backusella circina FSU 941]